MSRSRRVHETSITSEIFTEGGLRKRTGQRDERTWGRYTAKELIDNSLEAGENPSITIDIQTYYQKGAGRYSYKDDRPQLITVTDDGPGIPENQIRRIFGNVDKFVGTKRHYRTPTRGNQGNALMTVLGIQYVANSDIPLEVHSQNTEYRISVEEDPLTNEHTIHIDTDYSTIDGFSVTVDMRDTPYAVKAVVPTVHELAMLNPQADITLDVDGETTEYPSVPDSTVNPAKDREKPIWFGQTGFEDRMKADAGADEDLTIRTFIEEFHGLKSKADDVLRAADVDGNRTIADCYYNDGTDWMSDLHDAMCEQTRPFATGGLNSTIGSIGGDLASRVDDYVDTVPNVPGHGRGDMMVYYGDGDIVEHGGKTVPFYFELAAIPTRIREQDENPTAELIFGINQSVLYSNPSFSRPSMLTVGYLNDNGIHTSMKGPFRRMGHDFTVVANLMCPTVNFGDRGKQNFETEPFAEVIGGVTGKTIRKIEKDVRPALNKQRDGKDPDPKLNNKAEHGFIKDFIFDDFWDVYNGATDGGTYPLEMRQFFYAMRPPLEAEGKRRGYEYAYNASTDTPTKFKLRYDTFDTNVSKFEEEVLGERIIHRDARGFFVEPHSNLRVELDTVTVDRYDPTEQYGDILFIEKTGFDEVLRETEILKRYDIGLINGKGWNTIAGRDLIEKIQAANPDSRLFTLTDMDIAGVGIAADAKDTDTISEISGMDELNTIRLGVTMDDIDEYDLAIEEDPDYKNKQLSALETCWENGDIDRETYDFLGNDNRVEINAIAPNVLDDYLESKFEEYGVEKVAPEDPEDIDLKDAPDSEEVHDDAVKQAAGQWMENLLPDDVWDAIAENVAKPKDIEGDPGAMYDRITEELTDNPPKHWEDIADEMVETLRKEADEYTEDAVEKGVDYLEENHTIDFS